MTLVPLNARAAEVPEADGSERRVAPRTRVLKRAKILFNNNFSTFDCIVRNISATGALLTLDESAHLPREFNIRIGEEKTTRLAKLVYRRGMFAGIHFLHERETEARGEAAPAESERQAGSSEEAGIQRIRAAALPAPLARNLPWSAFASR